MAVATKGIVVLDHEQRKVCCELLWEEIRDGCSRDEAGELRLLMASARLYEMLDWRNNDSDHDEWTVVVDEEIARLAADFFGPFVEGYARPWLEENPQEPEFPLPFMRDTEDVRAYWADRYVCQKRDHRAVIAATEAILETVA
jgi:hypothetical protein